MTYSIHFYDKDKSPQSISNDRAEALKRTLVSNVQWIELGDDLIATSSISSVAKNIRTIEYKILPPQVQREASIEKITEARQKLVNKIGGIA